MLSTACFASCRRLRLALARRGAENCAHPAHNPRSAPPARCAHPPGSGRWPFWLLWEPPPPRGTCAPPNWLLQQRAANSSVPLPLSRGLPARPGLAAMAWLSTPPPDPAPPRAPQVAAGGPARAVRRRRRRPVRLLHGQGRAEQVGRDVRPAAQRQVRHRRPAELVAVLHPEEDGRPAAGALLGRHLPAALRPAQRWAGGRAVAQARTRLWNPGARSSSSRPCWRFLPALPRCTGLQCMNASGAGGLAGSCC